MVSINLHKILESFSLWMPKTAVITNPLYLKFCGDEEMDGAEMWGNVEVFEHAPGKYHNTFNRIGIVKVPVDSIKYSEPIEFQRPIIQY